MTHSTSLTTDGRAARRSGLLTALVILLASIGPAPVPSGSNREPAQDDSPLIVIDPATRYQTMAGWEATAQAGQESNVAYRSYRDELFDLAVEDLGIDRLRVEARGGLENSRDYWSELRAGQIDLATWRAVRCSTVNDNGSPFDLRMAGFHFANLDHTVEQVVLPMKQRLEAIGRRLFLNVIYVGCTHHIGPGLEYHHYDPEEYAEFVEATYRHLAGRHGLLPDSWEMMLEPDNEESWGGGALRRAMIAAGNRLAAMGITPRFIAPSTASLSAALSYADRLAAGGLPRFWADLSYHRYRGVSTAALEGVASRAGRWGLGTAMLERIGTGYEQLHEDLKVGQVSAWQQFTLAFPLSRDDGSAYYRIDNSNPASPRIVLGSRTAFLRQYFRYIRQGAVRIEASTTDPGFDPVAFINPDGTYIVVVKAARRGSFTVQALPAGEYAVSSTTARDVDARPGDFAIAEGERVILSIADPGVLTIAGK